MKAAHQFLSLFFLAALPPILLCQSTCLDDGVKQNYVGLKPRLCIDDKSGPNLFIDHSVKLIGSISYEDCSPAIDKEILVRVSDPDTKKVIFSTSLNDRGQFNFGAVPPGQYHVSAMLAGHGVFHRLLVSGTSPDLLCSEGAECRINLMIWWKQTGYPIMTCSQK